MNAPIAAGALAWREVVRFARQPARIAGALGTPLVFWLVIGGGLSALTRGGPLDYRAYFFPGTLALVALFAAIFGAISLIDDRAQGFLQGALTTPLPRFALVAGKTMGGGILASAQALLLLPLAPLAGIPLTAGSASQAALALVAIAFPLAAFGFACAWPFRSIQGFHAVMNLVLMPMWLLSGAVFPAAGAPGWLAVATAINPLTYGVALLRHALGEAAGGGAPGLPTHTTALLVLCAWGVASLAAAAWFAQRSERG